MSKGKVLGIIDAVIVVGFLGAAIANAELWGAFAVVILVNIVFWFAYAMGYDDAEEAR